MATFKYIGDTDEHVMGTKCFGYSFPIGVSVVVTDAHAISKLKGSPRFEMTDGDDPDADEIVDAPKRRGRPPKAKEFVTDDDNES